METTQATSQIKIIKKGYLFRILSLLFLIYLISISLVILYVFPYYIKTFWSEFFLEKLSFLYAKQRFYRMIINITIR